MRGETASRELPKLHTRFDSLRLLQRPVRRPMSRRRRARPLDLASLSHRIAPFAAVRVRLRSRRRARGHDAPLGAFVPLRSLARTERDDLDSRSPGVRDHVLDQRQGRARPAHAGRRRGVVGADPSRTADSEGEPRFSVDTVDPGDILAAPPCFRRLDADRVAYVRPPRARRPRRAPRSRCRVPPERAG